MFEAVYVHVPFCAAKCNYCAFNSKVADVDERENYVAELVTEITSNPLPPTPESLTLYFGGGTPTTLTLSQLNRIFTALNVRADEITIEVNPGTVNENYLRGLRDIGFNRISIGVQSFNNELLRVLGRIHDYQTALETIQTAKKFFDNVSIDLMYGLPGQSLIDVENSLEFAIAQDIQHISIYGLEIESGTNFGKLYDAGQLTLPDDAAMYDYITETLPRFGFARYEISNFAKPGFESRHNLGYWTGVHYVGFGAGAHSYDGRIRTSNIRDVTTYIEKIRAGESVSIIEEVVTKDSAMEEFCFLGLRMTKGISVDEFAKKFGANIFDVYGAVIDKYLKAGLLGISAGRIYLTARGMKLSNVVFADFLRE